MAPPTSVTAAGTYQFIGINNSGCADTAIVNLTLLPKPALGGDMAITKCTDSIVNLTTLYTTTALTASWTTGGNPVAMPAAVTSAGLYRLIAVNGSGCSDTAFVTLTNSQSLCIASLVDKILISPNPVSDKLTIQVVRTSSAKVGIVISNTGGQIVYSTTSQQSAGSQSYIIPMKEMVTICIILLLALGTLFANSTRVFEVNDDSARMQENGTYALNAIGSDLRQAGFYGHIASNDVKMPVSPLPLPLIARQAGQRMLPRRSPTSMV